MIKYDVLVDDLKRNPRDISTRPLTNKTGRWFYAYVEDEQIKVMPSKRKEPKSSISKPRTLRRIECEKLYDLYIQRKQGKPVSKEAGAITVNQVYWYGIFADIGL